MAKIKREDRTSVTSEKVLYPKGQLEQMPI